VKSLDKKRNSQQVNFMSISYLMSNTNPKTKRQKTSVIEWRIPEISVTNYNAAVDDAARAATAVGVLVAATDALTLGTRKQVAVGSRYVDSAALPPDPDAFVFPFDKFGIGFAAAGDNYVTSIPARDDSAITIGDDGVSVTLADGGAVAAWVTAFEAIVLSEELAAVTVTRMTITS
jgi:hypothetical protein